MKIKCALLVTTILLVINTGCNSTKNRDAGQTSHPNKTSVLADELEESLFNEILDHWYPRNIDSIHGGFISGFTNDWSPTERPLPKALVQQARHVWATSFILEHYPERKEYLEYASHGFSFMKNAMWDTEYGGFHSNCNADGTPSSRGDQGKRVYGQAFAVYGLAQYYHVSHNEEALELAKKAFLWMEENAHDKEFGGYFEVLERNGNPVGISENMEEDPTDSKRGGMKDYNSSIHIMEALTTLYRVWPDNLLRTRLEEMFYLIRDTFVHPDGYLQLYFYPDWTLVPNEILIERSGGNHYTTQHLTYGHDVETAFLLLETAHELGLGEDETTHAIAKRLVDHSIASGWDHEVGGFFDAGHHTKKGIEIISRQKAWWGQIEGLNALLLMHTIYPEDPLDYYGKFEQMWEYIDTYLIDKEFGGWYNAGQDTSPDNKERLKSYGWKTTYHNARGMVHCIEMLHSL